MYPIPVAMSIFSLFFPHFIIMRFHCSSLRISFQAPAPYDGTSPTGYPRDNKSPGSHGVWLQWWVLACIALTSLPTGDSLFAKGRFSLEKRKNWTRENCGKEWAPLPSHRSPRAHVCLSQRHFCTFEELSLWQDPDTNGLVSLTLPRREKASFRPKVWLRLIWRN